MTNKTPFGLYLVLAAAILAILFMSGVSLTGIPGVESEGSIIVKVVDNAGSPVSGAKVYMIPPDRDNPYDIMDKQTGYTELVISNSNGIADFGSSWDTSVSWSIGVRCTAPFNYSSNFIQYEAVSGSATCQPADFVNGKCDLGGVYNVKITCPPNKRPSVNDMISGNHTIAQEYVPEAQVAGAGPVCFMNTYIDESCGESNYGDKEYYFNADMMSPRGFKVKQCWTRPEWIYAECLPGEVGIGGYCVSQASYFTNQDCNSIRPGYTRVGNFCVAPMPSSVTTTTIPGGVSPTTTLPGGGYSLDEKSLLGFGVFILVIIILYMYKRGNR
jgi:hypothetical protein